MVFIFSLYVGATCRSDKNGMRRQVLCTNITSSTRPDLPFTLPHITSANLKLQRPKRAPCAYDMQCNHRLMVQA